jgi:hypothetical protein
MLENLKHTKLDPNLGDVGYLTKDGKKSIGVTGEVMLVDDSGLPIGGLEAGGAGSVSSAYIGKPANGDFITAYTAATQVTLSGYPGGLTTIYDEDIEFVRQINTAGQVVATYTKEDSAITMTGAVITVSGAAFAATDTFVVGTNIPRPTSGGAGGAGGGSIVYTNAAGDFIATPTNGAATITITGLPFTLEAIHVMGGSIEKKAVTTNLISTLNPTTISVSSGVITLGGIANFATGDEVIVTLIGPDKAYDRTLDIQKVVIQNPEYAHTTSVETLVSESAWPGLTSTTDETGGATQIVDSAAPFTLAQIGVAGGNVGLIGYKIYNLTDGTYANVASWVSTTTINTSGGTVVSWATDAYKMPEAKTYEINMETYNHLTLHWRLTADLHTTYYMKIYATLDATATVDSTVNWVDITTIVFGSLAGITADGITAGATVAVEGLKVFDTPTPMLKYMIKIIAEGNQAAATGSSAIVFIKKAS